METTKTERQRAAEELAAAFESGTRDNGEAFYFLRDGVPAWITERGAGRARGHAAG